MHCTHNDGVPPQDWSLPPAGVFFDDVELTAHIRSGGSHVMAKAVRDDWWFTLCTRTGQVIQFESSRVRGNWLFLEKAVLIDPKPGLAQIELERGIEVRIDEIAWIADGGH